ncbi:DUF805 domain-containing protein [Candidatus Endomicrobiellum devescovinae]|jgi:uncharacterized membrane protein YhaH (DUF805 family)|uniref:DUF805 domain-containing protein n=1 Tax=Candidatus Endomicrobiellum devescovinae TaxID=3242322 RepID=UPI00282FDEE2|nr:DUF805 domain-containing protein [Endomicrobium sp.]
MSDFIRLYFWEVVKFHYADFCGRATLKQFWYFVLTLFVLFIILNVIPVGVISSLVFWCILLPSLAIATRRLHDANISGWFQLLWFIPVFGWIIMLVMLSLPAIGSNRFDKTEIKRVNEHIDRKTNVTHRVKKMAGHANINTNKSKRTGKEE